MTAKPPPEEDREYDRFEALARRLIRVPKDAIDAERVKEKAHKG